MDTARRAAGELTYRDATEADVEALVPLIESAYRGDSSRAGWTTEADILQGQRTDPRGRARRHRGAGQPAADGGAGRASWSPAASSNTAATPPTSACSRSLPRSRARASASGSSPRRSARPAPSGACGEMHMTVISVRDELIAWYERRGYRRTGKMTPFPYGDERFGVPQRDDLAFELLVKELALRRVTTR